MARRPYEAVLILNPNVEEPELAAVQEKVLGQITARGGEVSRVDTWGRRRMFYPIKHQRDGHYLVCHFHADAPAITIFGRAVATARSTPSQSTRPSSGRTP